MTTTVHEVTQKLKGLFETATDAEQVLAEWPRPDQEQKFPSISIMTKNIGLTPRMAQQIKQEVIEQQPTVQTAAMTDITIQSRNLLGLSCSPIPRQGIFSGLRTV